MIKITDNSNPRLVTLLNATCVGRAQAVRYQGNVYLVVQKGMSQHTTFTVTPGFIALINARSLTIRAIDRNELVEPLNVEMIVTPWVGEIEHE